MNVLNHIGIFLLFINIAANGLAQTGSEITQLDPCERIEKHLSEKKYKEAYRQYVLVSDSLNCADQDLLVARILKGNNRFREALDILATLNNQQADSLRSELRLILGLEKPKEAFSVKMLYPLDTLGSEMILFFGNSPVRLIKEEIPEEEFPISVSSPPLYRLHSEDSLPYEWNDALQTYAKKYRFQLGPGCIGPDSVFYFTGQFQAVFKPRAVPSAMSVFSLSRKSKKNPETPDWVRDDLSFAHPTSSLNGKMIFSSNRPGGFGGMDLWSVEKLNDGTFSEPVNLGDQINSSFNEIFPALKGDTLYFVSDSPEMSMGGYDILFSEWPYEEVENLGAPLNSVYDDFNPVVSRQGLEAFVSNRSEKIGLDKIYSVKEFRAVELFDLIHGKLKAEGLKAGDRVELLDGNGEVIDYTFLDKEGKFTFSNVRGSENYEVRIPDAEMEKGDELLLFNSNFELIEQIKVSEGGRFLFELLSPGEYTLKKQYVVDESVLSIDILGSVETEEEGPEGIEIILQDSEGNTLGRAFTNSSGGFAFEKVKPDERYSIKSEVADPNAVIRIFNEEGEIIQTIQPNSKGEFVYVRLSDRDKIITITNEDFSKMRVAENEKFDLPAIYYELGQASLNDQSTETLQELVQILKENRHISIDLSGHTDSRGDATFNLELSEMRIKSVRRWLVNNGVSPDRVTGKGYGESRLLNKCSDNVDCTEEEHAKNRRTEIRFFTNNQK